MERTSEPGDSPRSQAVLDLDQLADPPMERGQETGAGLSSMRRSSSSSAARAGASPTASTKAQHRARHGLGDEPWASSTVTGLPGACRSASFSSSITAIRPCCWRSTSPSRTKPPTRVASSRATPGRGESRVRGHAPRSSRELALARRLEPADLPPARSGSPPRASCSADLRPRLGLLDDRQAVARRDRLERPRRTRCARRCCGSDARRRAGSRRCPAEHRAGREPLPDLAEEAGGFARSVSGRQRSGGPSGKRRASVRNRRARLEAVRVVAPEVGEGSGPGRRRGRRGGAVGIGAMVASEVRAPIRGSGSGPRPGPAGRCWPDGRTDPQGGDSGASGATGGSTTSTCPAIPGPRVGSRTGTATEARSRNPGPRLSEPEWGAAAARARRLDPKPAALDRDLDRAVRVGAVRPTGGWHGADRASPWPGGHTGCRHPPTRPPPAAGWPR